MANKSKHLETGRYAHYKGGEYNVAGTAINTETGEVVVLYEDQQQTPHVRPLVEFMGHVVVDDNELPRFTKLPDNAA